MGTETQDMVAAIERGFAALGGDDPALRKEAFCDDFHAFENGIAMTGPELFDLMSRAYAQGRRYQWSVNSPRIEVQGDLGFVAYVNRGFITEIPGSPPIPMAWLESALLRRHGSSWRIAFLHATRMPQGST